MTFELLPVMLANAIDDLDECLPHVARATLDPNRLDVACGIARRAGILFLFVDGDADRLHRFLAASARMFLHGVRTIGAGSLVASRCTALYDAMAARDDAATTQLSDLLLAAPHRVGKETAADHAWFRFLALANGAGGRHAAEVASAAAALAAVDGAPAHRMAAATALARGDAEAFASAVATLADRHEAVWALRFEKGTAGEDEYAAEGRLCVEGLALLALADRLGLTLEFEHPAIPDEARRRSAATVGADDWRTITSA